MSDIEWQETSELKPEAGEIRAFCQAYGLPADSIPASPDPVIFIERRALEGLYDFLSHDVQREHGGVLVGQPYYDAEMARYFVIIQAAVPAQEAEGSSVHLQFTPETWSYISGILEEDYPQQAIVGWYHSHPGLGIFMSGTDQATQRAFYNHPWCLAVVVDPIKQKTGWFIGEDSQPLHRQYVIPYEVAAEAPADQAEKDASSLEQEYWETLSLQRYDWLLPFGFLALGLAFLLWWLGRARVSGGWV